MIILKSLAEIEKIRRAGRLASACLDFLSARIVPGVTTGELNDLSEEFVRAHGGRSAPLGYRGFPKSICVAVNDEVVHGIPGPRILHTGDIVTVDVTVILDGYHGDTARTYVLPPISPLAQRLVDATYKSLFIGIESAQPGKRLGDVGWAVQSFIESHGFSVVRDYVGHGLGQAFHEDPQVPHYGAPGTGVLLRPGMVFTIEPMINAGTFAVRTLADGWTVITLDGSLSAQFEHTIAITAEGPIILTDGS